MRINNNIVAMNTHRTMNITGNALSNLTEKLSSGLNINKAADDAAGLAISEKMRAQIRGLNQASRNAQDAISLIQTAEGALAETHSIIHRMRELSVQAANDTNVDIDREEIQKEINALTSEVNRIAKTTEFNTQKILSGDADNTVAVSANNSASNSSANITEARNGFGVVVSKTQMASFSETQKAEAREIMTGLKKWWLKETEQMVKDAYGIEAIPTTMEVKFFDDSSNPTAAYVQYMIGVDSGTATGFTGMAQDNVVLAINLAASRPVASASHTHGGAAPFYLDRIMAHEMVHAVMARSMNFGVQSIWFKEGTAEFIHGADDRVAGDIYQLGGGSGGNTTTEQRNTGVLAIMNTITATSAATIEASWTGGSSNYSAAYIATRYLDALIRESGGTNQGSASSSDGIKVLMQYLAENTSRTLDDGLAYLASQNLISNITNTQQWLTQAKAEITTFADLQSKAKMEVDMTLVSNPYKPGTGMFEQADTGSILGKLTTGSAVKAKDIVPQTGGWAVPEEEQPMNKFTIVWPNLDAPSTPSTPTTDGDSITGSRRANTRPEGRTRVVRINENPNIKNADVVNANRLMNGEHQVRIRNVGGEFYASLFEAGASNYGKEVKISEGQIVQLFSQNEQGYADINVGYWNSSSSSSLATVSTAQNNLQSQTLMSTVPVSTAQNNLQWQALMNAIPVGQELTWSFQTSAIFEYEANFQIGANSGQSMTISIDDMSAWSLGISSDAANGRITASDGTVASYVKVKNVSNGTDNTNVEYALDVSSHEKATAAISVFNDAIQRVSSQRSQLGAFQNRLESTIKNLDNTSENLQSAEGRIRDADMAKTMMEHAKQNILMQATQAMQVHANQSNQGIIQLLR